MAMRFEHEFTVPVPVERVWPVLLDVERVAPCLPGATLEVLKDDSLIGRIKVKVGSITIVYRGEATFEDVDESSRTLALRASGKESRGPGTAAATVAARLRPEGPDDGATLVTVETSLTVTGRPAQFGREVVDRVGAKLINRFAANLSALLKRAETEAPSRREVPTAEEARRRDVHPAGTCRTSRTPEEEDRDLLEVAGLPVLRRTAPLLGAVAGLIAAGWLVRRALRRRSSFSRTP